MFNKRWYDHDPLMSMAVSLLQNTSDVYQEMTAAYIQDYLNEQAYLNQQDLISQLMNCCIFPFKRRDHMEPAIWDMLELLKTLPHDKRKDIALKMISYVYELENLDQLCLQEIPNLNIESIS